MAHIEDSSSSTKAVISLAVLSTTLRISPTVHGALRLPLLGIEWNEKSLIALRKAAVLT